jgi:hypothetical protein
LLTNTASDNVAVGYNCLDTCSSGSNNTAVGTECMDANTTGSGNVAMGYRTLDANTSGSSNVAIGQYALGDNTTAGGNTAVGYAALTDNTTGDSNTAVGFECVEKCTTGIHNTGMGYRAGFTQTTGSYNITIGNFTGDAITTGQNNTLVGYGAGSAITTGGNNTIVGMQAGSTLTTGGNCILIGKEANVSGANNDELVIGNSIAGIGNNTGLIYPPGGGGVYQASNASTWAQTSDERIKKNIVDNNEGLSKLKDIQVRNFEYRTEDEVTELPSHLAVKQEGIQLGVIAQEIEKVLPEVVITESTGVKTIKTDNLTWYLINAVKELSAQVEELKSKLNEGE